jgi:hypothetical protein
MTSTRRPTTQPPASSPSALPAPATGADALAPHESASPGVSTYAPSSGRVSPAPPSVRPEPPAAPRPSRTGPLAGVPALPADAGKIPPMTLESLDAWAAAPGQSREESQERAAVVIKLTGKSFFGARILKKPRNLTLDFMKNLTGLPEGLSVAGMLQLGSCIALTQLPMGLAVGGSLLLTSCIALTQLPKGLSVGGSLVLSGCTALTQLPEDLSVGRHLDLSGCTALTQLPDELSVGGNLDLSSCTALTHLPDRLAPLNGTNAGGFDALVRLFGELAEASELYMDDGTAPAKSPEGLAIAGSLYLDGCTALTRLPEHLTVGDNLFMRGCTALTRLPTKKLEVKRNLLITGCTSLVQLSEKLAVKGSLSLSGCTALAELPDGLLVGRIMNLSGCTSLTHLPESVLQWPLQEDGEPHIIDLSSSGIPEERLAALEHIAGAGVQLSYSVVEDRTTGDRQFASLSAAMAFWRPLARPGAQNANPKNDTAPDLHAEPVQLDSFLNFLDRLRDTADFKNTNSRPLLAKRIVGLTTQLAASESLAAVCHERIGQALESCGDRVIWAMNQLELTVRVHQAQQAGAPEQELRDLARSLLRLQVVHQHAAAKVASLRAVDPIEVYLAYETQLAHALGLPLSTHHMLYENISNVNQADLRKALRAAQQADADPRQVEAYLTAWGPWQQFIRGQQAEACGWERLQPMPQGANLDETQVCVFTRETVADLQASFNDVVAVRNSGGQWEPYDFHSLLEWWAQEGTHPVQRSPMRLEDIHRLDGAVTI